MSQVQGRAAAPTGHSFVMFLIGMRVNRPLQFRKWTPIARAFPPMLRELYAHPESGFLGGEQFFRLFPITTISVSYWRTLEDLERFATGKGGIHVEAWSRFNRQVGTDGSVGIWHETYNIELNHYETRYVNMPYFGLGKALRNTVADPVLGLASAGLPIDQIAAK